MLRTLVHAREGRADWRDPYNGKRPSTSLMRSLVAREYLRGAGSLSQLIGKVV